MHLGLVPAFAKFGSKQSRHAHMQSPVASGFAAAPSRTHSDRVTQDPGFLMSLESCTVEVVEVMYVAQHDPPVAEHQCKASALAGENCDRSEHIARAFCLKRGYSDSLLFSLWRLSNSNRDSAHQSPGRIEAGSLHLVGTDPLHLKINYRICERVGRIRENQLVFVRHGGSRVSVVRRQEPARSLRCCARP